MCPETTKCIVSECENLTIRLKPLCRYHQQEKKYCSCGQKYIISPKTNLLFCKQCDDYDFKDLKDFKHSLLPIIQYSGLDMYRQINSNSTIQDLNIQPVRLQQCN